MFGSAGLSFWGGQPGNGRFFVPEDDQPVIQLLGEHFTEMFPDLEEFVAVAEQCDLARLQAPFRRLKHHPDSGKIRFVEITEIEPAIIEEHTHSVSPVGSDKNSAQKIGLVIERKLTPLSRQYEVTTVIKAYFPPHRVTVMIGALVLKRTAISYCSFRYTRNLDYDVVELNRVNKTAMKLTVAAADMPTYVTNPTY
jgi:hypothetical protein